MSLQLNHAAFTQATSRKERTEAFKHLSQADAQQILKGLHADLRGKPGVLRLMHTGRADQPMKFQRAGGFMQIFLRKKNVERSREALTTLLTRAGLPQDRVKQFTDYAEGRRAKGVETSKLMTFLSEAVDFTAPDMETALKQLGVSNPEQRTLLGEGAFGKALQVSYQGQAQVLKLFHSQDGEDRRVLVRDDALSDADVLKMLRNRPAFESDSFVSVQNVPDEDASAIAPKNAGQGQEPARARAGSYMLSPSIANSPDEPDFLAQTVQAQDPYDLVSEPGDEAAGAKAAPLDPKAAAGASAPLRQSALHPAEPQRSLSMNSLEDDDDAQALDDKDYVDRFQNFQQVSSRASATVADDADLEPDSYQGSKLSDNHPSIGRGSSLRSSGELEPEPVVQAPAAPEVALPPRAPKGVHLGRSHITNAVRLKDMPGIVQPSRLLVREKTADGQERIHAVRGGAEFKAWARTQAVASDLVIRGMLMPLAPGKPPVQYVDDEVQGSSATAQVQPAQVQSIAKRGLDILKGLQARGFIHGDIKPENMLYSADQDTLNLIDTDGLQKISKRPDARLPQKSGLHTPTYTHPAILDRKSCGAGRDLYALGVSLLETSLLARGEDSQWNAWYQKLVSPALYGLLGASTRDALAQQARNNPFPPNSAEHFALLCIAESLDYEKNRLVQGLQDRFERYTPDNAGHPLNKVAQHPFVA